MVPGNNPVMLQATAAGVTSLTVAGVAASVVPYESVRPYSKDTAVLLPWALTLPFKVALVSVKPLAASVSATGAGGIATSA
jgi:hypothetical protein